MNKLQNGVILSFVSKIWKIWNVLFVANLILSSRFEFYYDDIIVMSFTTIKYGNIANESFSKNISTCPILNTYKMYNLFFLYFEHWHS